MKLGFIADPYNDDLMQFLKEHDIHYIECCLNEGTDTAKILADTENLIARFTKYDMKGAAIGRWGMKRIDEDGSIIPEALEHDMNLIRVCQALGTPVYNCGCNFAKNRSFEENLDIAAGYFERLIEFSADKGVKIAVYNCSWENNVYDASTWTYILEKCPALGIKYDTTHCIHRGGDYLKEMRDFGERFYHFHLKGTLMIDGKHYDDPPVGLDSVNWGAVMAILLTKGYKDVVSMEPHSMNWIGDRGIWGIEFAINYIRPYIMSDTYKCPYPKEYRPW